MVASKIPTGSVLFTYYDSNGAPIANQTSNTEADLIQIRSVKIALTVDVDPARGGGPVTVSSTVVLPNLGIAKRSAASSSPCGAGSTPSAATTAWR